MIATWLADRALGPYRRFAHRRVILNMLDDRAWEGIIVEFSAPLITLKGAVMLEEGREPVRMDGEVVLDRDHVDFIQAF